MYKMLKGAARRVSLHMPAGQGKAPFAAWNAYRMDTTELPVTDDLYAPQGAIAWAQTLAAKSAGAAHTLMLHGGSTAGMHAMLLYAAQRGDTVILPRNVHISAIHLCATAGLVPVFAWPSFTQSGLPYTTDGAYLEAINANPQAKAILIVRPDYYGMLCWPARAVQAAHDRGMLVLCDEAHGAHFNWDGDISNAGALGADLWVQSAHKTLPALTANAWLHAGARVDAPLLLRRLRMVQTSSPSFIGMLALDDARAWMDRYGAAATARLRKAVHRFHTQAAKLGYANGQDAPDMKYDDTRLVIAAPCGGFALADALAEQGLDVEMSDERRVVCILSLMDGDKRLRKLLRALKRLPEPKGTAQDLSEPPKLLPERSLPLHKAAFAPSEPVPLKSAAGRVSAGQVGLYPPGTALLTAGEEITNETITYLLRLDSARVFGLNADGTLNCIR